MDITGSEYAKRHGLSRQWVCEMLRQGRIEGARRSGKVWLVPEDAPLPVLLAPGQAPKPESARVIQLLERKARKEASRAGKQAARIHDAGLTEEERRAMVLGKLEPWEAHAFKQRERGCTKAGEAWEFDGEWVGPVWLKEMTRAEFDARREEFMEAAEAIESGAPDAQWPAWIPQ